MCMARTWDYLDAEVRQNADASVRCRFLGLVSTIVASASCLRKDLVDGWRHLHVQTLMCYDLYYQC